MTTLGHRRPARRAARGGRLLAACVLAGIVAACAHTRSTGQDGSFITQRPPVLRESIAWHLVDVTVFAPLANDFDLLRMTRRAIGRPAPSANMINGFIYDSSFFTNRNIAAMTPDDVRRGPTPVGGEPKPPMIITRYKDEGKSPGFFAIDAKGDRYLCKADLPGYHELMTGAEAVTSRLLYALGYYVPSYEVIEITADQLLVAPEANVTRDFAQQMFQRYAVDGKLRLSASRFVEGERLGPFSFKRYRNFTELRALKLAYAWTNNTDAKDQNTLMTWDGTRAIGYLIDFGTSMGADATHGVQPPCRGWVNDVDIKDFTLKLMTLGLHDNGCDVHETTWSPAVGMFSPRVDPVRWEPYAPNLAFEDITPDDARWISRRIAALSSAQIEAAVRAGQYHHEQDAQRILEVLEARRARILAVYPPDGPTRRWDHAARPIAPNSTGTAEHSEHQASSSTPTHNPGS